ncbi:MAG: cell wall hydrolase [Lachnospiraceae bacterium]
MKRIILCTLTFIVLFSGILTASASTTDEKLQEATDNLDQLEESKQEAEAAQDALLDISNELDVELTDLNQQLSDTAAQITDLEQQIVTKNTEIEMSKNELAEAEAIQAEQYVSMKKRIVFLYEQGSESMIGVLLESESMSDFLNKAVYIESMSQYDRSKLNEYEIITEQIAQKKQELEAQGAALAFMKIDLEEKSEQIDTLIDKVEVTQAQNQQELIQSQEEIAAYDAQIAQMKAYEEELEQLKIEEAKRLAEERKKAEEAEQAAAAQTPEDTGGGQITASDSDLAMLAAIVECEAGGESYEGQLAVASVVINRVRSGSFPNSISGVIYQGGQFSPVASGRFAVVLARGASASARQAASQAISGQLNISALYFCRNNGEVAGTVIGNHVFY